MKKIILYIIINFFFISNSFSSNNIVFLDVQLIIDSSKLGMYYKDKILNTENLNKKELILIENEIKKDQDLINSQKNILKKEEINKKIANLNEKINKYKELRIKLNTNLINEKKNYTKKILELLNPLITNYVKKNKINLVIEKKNVLIGQKNLDITSDILKIFNVETENKNLINAN